jgi:hypothetical protein
LYLLFIWAQKGRINQNGRMIFFKLYSPEDSEGGGGENPPKKVDVPKDYKTLTLQERKNWNDFLDYLGKEGVGGKADLDKRDQTLGLNYLNKYNKENPDKSIDPQRIKDIQYEQYQLRKGDSFGDLKPEELAYIRKGLNPAFLTRPVSDTDNWLGSLTSKEYYPEAHRGTNTEGSYDFGVDVESYVRSLNNKSLSDKYKIKTQ